MPSRIIMVCTDIIMLTDCSEDFLYALVSGNEIPPITTVSPEKQKEADKLVSDGWKLQDALEWVTGRTAAVEFFSLYLRDPENWYNNLRQFNILI